MQGSQEPPKQQQQSIQSQHQPRRNRVQSTIQTGQQVSLCESHNKKIEAFCDLDKKLLCIDCILNENHKSHEILSLEKACQKEKYVFEVSLKTALQKENEVQHQIHRIKNYLSELEESANRNRSEISKIFNEIRNKIIEKETNMKKMISDTLEKEQQMHKSRIVQLEDQMRCIQDLKDEKQRIDAEPALETLLQSAFRWEIENEANRKIETLAFKQVFLEIKKDEEIAGIVRAIIPLHLRTSLLQGTVSSSIKKKEKQDDLKRREQSNKPAIPVYDYDHKFNYRNGYLRDDRVPAFISTKQNQQLRKETEVEKAVNTSTDFINESRTLIGVVQKQNNNGGPSANNNYNKQQQNRNLGRGGNTGPLGSNDNSPRTQQQIINQQTNKYQQNVGQQQLSGLQQVNQRIQKKSQTLTKRENVNAEISILSKDESSILNQNQNRVQLITNQHAYQLSNKRSISSGRANDELHCTLPSSIQKKDSPPKKNIREAARDGSLLPNTIFEKVEHDSLNDQEMEANQDDPQLQQYQPSIQIPQPDIKQSIMNTGKLRTSNLAEARQQKKQQKQQQYTQVSQVKPIQNQPTIFHNPNASISMVSTQTKKKKQKGKDSQYFEFTNEKLFKQIIEKKGSNNQLTKTQKSQKTLRSSHNPQKIQRKSMNQNQNIKSQAQYKQSESSDQSQNPNQLSKDDRQKSSQDEQHEYEETESQQEEDSYEEDKIEDEFSDQTQKKRRGVNQFNDRSHVKSEDMDDVDVAPEISSIHESPQKRQSSEVNQSPDLIIKTDSPHGQTTTRDKKLINMGMSGPLPLKVLRGLNSDTNKNQVELIFDDDQSRIVFQNDQNTFNEIDRDQVSFRLDFDVIMKSNNDDSSMFQFKQLPIGKEGDIEKMIPHSLVAAQLDDNSKQQSSVTSMTMDFENLFKMKEEYIFVFCGFNERFLTSVEVLDVTRGIWREFPESCSNRAKFQVQPINDDSIIIFGGKDEFGIQLDEVEDFNIKDMKSFLGDWKLPTNISGFASCQVKPGTIAICGGNTGPNIINKFYMITFKKGETVPQISEMPPMIKAREEFALVMGPEGKLYAVGGYNSQEGCLSSIESFDFQTQQWQIITSLDEGKRALNAVALPDGIYIIGGYNGKEYLNTVQKYDIASNKMSYMRPMNTSRGTFSALVAQNCHHIYAIGGFNGQPLDHVERYDTMQNQWEYLAPMKQKRFMHASCMTFIEKKK